MTEDTTTKVAWLTLLSVNTSYVAWLTLLSVNTPYVAWLNLLSVNTPYVAWLTPLSVDTSCRSMWEGKRKRVERIGRGREQCKHRQYVQNCSIYFMPGTSYKKSKDNTLYNVTRIVRLGELKRVDIIT